MQYLLFAGIPTVKRQYQSYLVTTLQSILDNISKVTTDLTWPDWNIKYYFSIIENVGSIGPRPLFTS